MALVIAGRIVPMSNTDLRLSSLAASTWETMAPSKLSPPELHPHPPDLQTRP